MMSIESIRHLQRSAAESAERSGAKPKVPMNRVAGIKSEVANSLRSIPNFGNYRPAGWALVPRAELVSPESFGPYRLANLGCDDDYVFVDSSGFGGKNEPALAFDEFVDLVMANPKLGWAIVEAGQFQVVVGAFRRES